MQSKNNSSLRKRQNDIYFLGTMHLESIGTKVEEKKYLKTFLTKSQVVIMEYPAGKFNLKSIFIAPIFTCSLLIYSLFLILLGKLAMLIFKIRADDRASFLKFIEEAGIKHKIINSNIETTHPSSTLKIIKFNDIVFGNWFSRHFIVSGFINYFLIIGTFFGLKNNLNIINFIWTIFFLFISGLIIVVSITYGTRNKNIINLVRKLNSFGFNRIFILYGAGHFWDIKRRVKKLPYKIDITELNLNDYLKHKKISNSI